MTMQSKTPREIVKKELVKLMWRIVAAVVALLALWFVARPILQNLFQNLGHGNSAPSSQNNIGNQSAK